MACMLFGGSGKHLAWMAILLALVLLAAGVLPDKLIPTFQWVVGVISVVGYSYCVWRILHDK